MPKKKFVIQLNEAQKAELSEIVKKGESKGRVRQRAQILLWSDAGKTDEAIAELLKIRPLTVAQTRQRWVEKRVLTDAPRPGRPAVLDGKQRAFLVALACSEAPEGRERWTVRLLADRLVELQVVEEVGRETVRETLKKTNLSLG